MADKLEYGDLKIEFLTCNNKGKNDDKEHVHPWNEFRDLYNFNDHDDDNGTIYSEEELDDKILIAREAE
eukprot:15327295-Ditylum_brightwellii.AAC.1